MSLFDQISGTITGATANPNGALLAEVMHLLNDPKIGGLTGLVQSFHRGGLTEVVNSWISTGHNLPVTAEQITSILGNDQVRNVASKLGIGHEQASAKLAEFLPQIVDKLTPGGNLSEGGDLMNKGLDLLKGKLFV